jgi:hypothetical protein
LQYLFKVLDVPLHSVVVPGTNTLAAHCRNTGGPGFIDLGLFAASEKWKNVYDAKAIVDPSLRLAAAYALHGRSEARHQQQYTALLTGLATAAAERGEIDRARMLYERLTKLQPENGLWTQRLERLRAGVLAVWDFERGPGTWGAANHCDLSVRDGILTARTTGDNPFFSTPVAGPAGAKMLLLRYRSDEAFTMQIFWADASGGFGESRHCDYPLPAAPGEWRETTLSFRCDGALTSVRLSPNSTREHPLQIDSIMLRELETAD